MKKAIYEILERAVVKIVLSLLGISSSFPAFLAAQLIEHGFEKVVIPLFNLAIRHGYLYYDTGRGKIIAKKLQTARDENDQVDYDDASDGVFR